MRSIRKIIPAQRINMGGHLLDQPLPVEGVDQIDPFLLIHHWDQPVPSGKHPNQLGVGGHPHRGFSPVTFIFKGDVQHRDSLGNNEIVGAGGTQWMHAGRGITHSERPSKELAKHGGDQELIQFWVNSPAKYKMEAAYYQAISEEDTPKIKGEKFYFGVVAGEYEGIKGAAPTYSPMTLLRGVVEEGGNLTLRLPASYNTVIYLLDGRIDVNGKKAFEKDMVWFQNDGEEINIHATETTRFMVLSGEPIGEKVAKYGPFVMNTQTEVLQAMRDSQMGKMGFLIEEF